MSAHFLAVSNTFIEVLLWFSDMAECRDITRSAARPSWVPAFTREQLFCI